MPQVKTGPLLIEGKTKRVYEDPENNDRVIIVSKDDITAGDGAKHDVFEGKAKAATQTTCNVFRFLNSKDIPTAFLHQIDDVTFCARKCTMLPYEVVVRREAFGSYLKRHPELEKGHVFPELVLEFFLKTSGKRWGDYGLVCDDPLMNIAPDGSIQLLDPKQSANNAKPFLVLDPEEVYTGPEGDPFWLMGEIAKATFRLLAREWEKADGRLVDYKVEFAISGYQYYSPFLADVIDNDSWRVIWEDEKDVSKQAYREGGDLDEVAANYQMVADLTGKFGS